MKIHDGYKGYWYDIRKEFKFSYKIKFSERSLMVWRAVSWYGMYFPSTVVNSVKYIAVFKQKLMLFLIENFELYLCYASGVTRNLLACKTIYVLAWSKSFLKICYS